MSLKTDIIAALPPFKDQRIMRVDRQDTTDIIREILRTHNDYLADYDKIYDFFDTGEVKSTCRDIWEFLKRNVPYTKESGDFQTVKSPAAILHPGETIDCKNYSLFIAGVLDAINRNENDHINWFYRFASYNSDPEPGHVFVVVQDNDREIWIDPVLTHFNEKKMTTYQTDKKPKEPQGIAGIYAISGINDGQNLTLEVDSEAAIKNFLVCVNLNLFNLKRLLLSDTDILYGTVKQYFLQNNYPFDTLLNILQNG